MIELEIMTQYRKEVEKIKERMRNLFPATPLEKCDYLSKKYKANIYLKREDRTPVRSYKIRGAFHLIDSILQKQSEEERKKQKFVCASAGNHAQGFAYACNYFKVQGVVFMPTTTPKQKIERTKDFGGKFLKIELVGDTFDEAYAKSIEYAEKNKATMVPPFDHPEIVKAAGTVSSEILDSLGSKSLDLIIFPVGGGGLSSGNTKYLKEVSPNTEIFYTEPAGAPSLKTALEKNKLVSLDKIDTFVDGCAVAKIGNLPFKILKKYAKDVILCPENRVSKTILEFLHYTGIVLEPAGALAIDALEDIFKDKKRAEKLRGKNIVAVVSGGNFDFSRLPDLEERKLKYEGLKRYMILKLPQRPGALKEFLTLLGKNDDIVRFEYLKKSSKNFGSVLLGIQTNKKENFDTLFKKLKENNFEFEDITDNELFFDFII